MSIRAFVEQLGSVGPDRMVDLVRNKIVSDYYVLVGPDEGRPAAVANRAAWHDVDRISSTYVPRWAWYVCSEDQHADVARIQELDRELNPVGWCANIEKPLQHTSLETLLSGIHALGKPIVASLAGTSASHTWYDYRALERYNVSCDWQAYFDSGEGQSPAYSVQELYASSFVIPGWEYRSRWGNLFGWGVVSRVEQGQVAHYDSYRRPGSNDSTFAVGPREWGNTVVSRSLQRDGQIVGQLMGRAAYSKIRVTLDVTRTAQSRKPEEWTPIAASARVPGATRRPVSLYLLDNASDEVVKAIAMGAP